MPFGVFYKSGAVFFGKEVGHSLATNDSFFTIFAQIEFAMLRCLWFLHFTFLIFAGLSSEFQRNKQNFL